jgi:hypothetical protein
MLKVILKRKMNKLRRNLKTAGATFLEAKE